jgi:hypothetical protein
MFVGLEVSFQLLGVVIEHERRDSSAVSNLYQLARHGDDREESSRSSHDIKAPLLLGQKTVRRAKPESIFSLPLRDLPYLELDPKRGSTT